MSATQDILVWVIGSTGSATILGGLAAVRKLLSEVRGISRSVDNLQYQVGTIKHEVMPNNGTSLKDAVNRIEASQLVQDEKINQHRDELSRLLEKEGRR